MRKLAAIGNGAMGWAARARLMGWEVAAFEAEPDRAQRAYETASAYLPALYDVALPSEGPFAHFDDLGTALRHARLIIYAGGRTKPRDVESLAASDTPLLMIASDAQIAAARAASPDPTMLIGLTQSSPLLPIANLDINLAEFEQFSGIFADIGVSISPKYDIHLPDWVKPQDPEALVSILRALKARKAGIGAFLAEHEARLAPQAPADLSQPPVTLLRQVPPDWVDYNGHMNEARYLTAFSDATDRLLLWAGMDAACIAQGHSVFTVETHLRHLGEVDIGAVIEVRSRVLNGTGKRLHLWHELRSDETLAATAEQLLLHVDLKTRRVGQPRGDVGAWLAAAERAQAALPMPEGLGRFVGAPR